MAFGTYTNGVDWMRTRLAMQLPELAEIYGQLRPAQVPAIADKGFTFSAGTFADRLVFAHDAGSPTDLFMMLASGGGGSSAIHVLKTEYKRFLETGEDFPEPEILPGGGVLVRTPEGDVVVGSRSVSEHPAVARAAIVIPSSCSFVYATPQLAPLGAHAEVNGRRIEFGKVLSLGDLRLERSGNFEVAVFYKNKLLTKASLFEGFSRQIGSLVNADAYETAWKDYLRMFLSDHVIAIQDMIEALIERKGEDARPDSRLTKSDMKPILRRISEMERIRRNTLPSFMRSRIPADSWERIFVGAQCHDINNRINLVTIFSSFLEANNLTFGDLKRALEGTCAFFRPFAYLNKTIQVVPKTRRSLKVTIPNRIPDEPGVQDPMSMREIIDEIVFRAGKRGALDGPADISFGYDKRMTTLVIRNESADLDPFADFRRDREGRMALEFFARNLGPGAGIRFHDGPFMNEDGLRFEPKIESIEIIMPDGQASGGDTSATPSVENNGESADEGGLNVFDGSTTTVGAEQSSFVIPLAIKT